MTGPGQAAELAALLEARAELRAELAEVRAELAVLAGTVDGVRTFLQGLYAREGIPLPPCLGGPEPLWLVTSGTPAVAR